jgi:hypothetical protein
MMLSIIMLLWPIVSFAQIYEYKNSHNDKIYSDRFPTNLTSPAKAIHATTASNTMGVAQNELALKNSNVFELKFVTPTQLQTFWNQDEIPVRLQTIPKLDEGQTLQILLDNSPLTSPVTQGQVTLRHILTGTHQLEARVLGRDRNVINASDKLIFYVHHTSSPQ